MSQQCSWPTYSWPLEGRCLYYALPGLTQAPGLAGGTDYFLLSTGLASIELLFLPPSFLASQQLELVWDSDSLDWKDLPASEITQRVTSKVQPGSIVLFHNAALHTPEALPAILETLLQEGYTFVPISQLILPGTCGTGYTIDHTGCQCPACQ